MTPKVSPRLLKRLMKIRALLLDVEGVLTNSSVPAILDATDARSFSARDKDAIRQAHGIGFRVGILTSSTSAIIAERARELAIHDVYQGSFNKLESYERFKSQYGYQDEEIAYVGDGILDIPVLKRVGFAAAPPAAHAHAKLTANYVAARPGGDGAVSEIIDLLIRARTGK
jgi:3-deoxy-D-manno-octulosonate 8-phosphate phosphatase (KDO 8-P phosphatase)